MGTFKENNQCEQLIKLFHLLKLFFQATFSNWYEDEPNNAGEEGEDCVETTNFNKWNDLSCDETRMFICIFDEQLNTLSADKTTSTPLVSTTPQ